MGEEERIVEVIIPMYRVDISEFEMRSLKQVYQLLNRYQLVVIKPESLDLSILLTQFPLLKTKSFQDDYFKSIAGYNKLMMSSEFYGAFRHTKYILIYQLDAYVFRDELMEWCNKDYDYIGAPWLKRPVYDMLPVSTMMRIARFYYRYRKQKSKQVLYNKVGNGGLSLRKVESHYKAVIKYKEEIQNFQSRNGSHLYNEDVFWATVPQFNYPSVNEALDFAFDKYPAYCYKLKNNRLPFGCHGWYKRKMRKFWENFIPV